MPQPRAYYNEIDANAAAWLRELIAGGHIAPGDVDTRSIADVQSADLAGYTQCHFFAGIGGWSYALRLAGWLDRRPVWTGSCPCQPFAMSGKRKGTDDPRHLWPEFYRLIGERRPTTIFGEQVAGKDGYAWFDIFSADLESSSYAVGAADLAAACVGAPHIRQRLFWLADSACAGRWWRPALAPERPAFAGVQEYELRRFRTDSLPTAWPDGRGSASRELVTDVCAPSYGIPGRVGSLRGFGNAIDPEVAAGFVRAFLETQRA
jgi:DNA (cytosine-5)-methyltransferase 1